MRIPTAKNLGSLVLWRDSRGVAHANIPRRLIRHSPTGYEWGYGGSGPADLALNTLYHLYGRDIADRYYHEFTWEIIASIKREGDVIPTSVIDAWVQSRLASDG